MGTYAFKDQFYLTKQIERSQNLLICKTKQYKILNKANKIVIGTLTKVLRLPSDFRWRKNPRRRFQIHRRSNLTCNDTFLLSILLSIQVQINYWNYDFFSKTVTFLKRIFFNTASLLDCTNFDSTTLYLRKNDDVTVNPADVPRLGSSTRLAEASLGSNTRLARASLGS